MDYKEEKLPPNPYAKANPISKLLFLWVLPLFRKGYSLELETSHLYDVLREDETAHLGNKLEGYWKQELGRDRKPSLMRALIKLCWKTFTFVTVFYMINQCVIIVSQPIILRLLVRTFNEAPVDTSKAYMYAGLLSVTVFLQTLTIHPVVFRVLIMAMKIRVALSTLIYRKSLRLSKSAQNRTNSGHIVNILSNDATRFDVNANFLPFIFSAPIQFSTLMYLLYDQVGPSSFVGLAFVVVLLPLQYYIGKYSAIFRLLIAKRTDERGRLMNEIIVGMRVIKQYAWEKPFSSLIDRVRKLEVVELQKRGILRGLHAAMITLSPKLVQYLTFLAFVLIEDEPMTAEKVFFVTAVLFAVTKMTINFTPAAAAGIGEMIIAVRRIQEFLLLEDQNINNDHSKLCTVPYPNSETVKNNAKVSFVNVCAQWTEQDVRPTLEKVTFTVEGDSDALVMVVGAVGSSKTSLLHAILDELPISSGILSVQGTVSYASQEPWIFSGNFRQNILFGLEYNEQRYKSTLAACALEEDLLQFPYGDMTIVGERGVALSGGQKARLNLARALYRKADIYLLDDPLSAVDTRVSRHLFEKCIRDYLRGSIRILVTHQLQYLPQADLVIVLDQGKILAQGPFKNLVDAGIDFVSLLSSGDSSSGESELMEENNNLNVNLESSERESEKVKVDDLAMMINKPKENIEKKIEGSVTGRTYVEYFLSGHSMLGFLSLIGICILCQLLISGNDYWLSYWTNAEARRLSLGNNETICENENPSDDKKCEDTYLGKYTYLYIYTGFALAVTVFSIGRGMWFFVYCARISVNIHDRMFRSMVRAPVRFFDDNPSGRVMNRFTKDVGTIDELLPPAFIDAITIFLQVFHRCFIRFQHSALKQSNNN